MRFVVEPALPLARVLARLSPRDRALEVFGLLRIWDTEDNCGVLVYILLADRDVEIVADRGIHRAVGDARRGRRSAGRWRRRFATAASATARKPGVRAINALLQRHYARHAGDVATAVNELPDRPLVL